MNVSIVKQVEIAFWDFTIQTMSENKQVRRVIRMGYHLVHHPAILRVGGLLAITALSGLLSGMILGVITSYLH